MELSLEAAWKSYGTIKAVDGVSLSIKTGETIALVGRSGCGKSTLAMLLAGLVFADKGACLYGGQNIAQLTGAAYKSYRQRVQLVFQDYAAALNPRLPIGKSIGEPMINFLKLGKKERDIRVEDLLVQVGLCPEDRYRYPKSFSGGQRQRICIARALAARPQFLLLDEVTSSLDAHIQAQIVHLLKDLQQTQPMGMLFITHDIGLAQTLCDTIVVMEDGRIIERVEGKAMAQAKHPHTKQLLEAAQAVGEKRDIL